jgi:hypothetical protein
MDKQAQSSNDSSYTELRIDNGIMSYNFSNGS